MTILGFGALNVDFIYEVEDIGFIKCGDLKLEPGKEVILEERLFSKFSERITRFGTLRKVSPGGSAANTCYVLSLMGMSTSLLGVLGLDREGDFYMSKVPTDSTTHIIRRGKTGIAYIINERGKTIEGPDRVIILIPRSNSDIKREDIDLGKISSFSWIHMSSFVSSSALDAQRFVKEALKDRTKFSIDPGEIYASLREKIHDLIFGTEILFSSEKELTMMFGGDLESSVKEALKLTNMVVVKKGKDGASLYSKNDVIHVKAERTRAIDTTGAGDVLNGVFLGLFLKGKDPLNALEKAVFFASESVKGYGRDNYPKDLMES